MVWAGHTRWVSALAVVAVTKQGKEGTEVNGEGSSGTTAPVLVSASWDATVRLWRDGCDDSVRVVEPRCGRLVSAAAVGGDGRVAVAGGSGVVRVVDVASGAVVGGWECSARITGVAGCSAGHSDTRLVVAGHDGVVVLSQ